MVNDKTIQSYGLKVISIAAVAILIFSAYSIFLADNEGESKAVLSVDEFDAVKVVKRGDSITHNITVENTAAGPIYVELSAVIISVTPPGVIGNWSVRFTDNASTEITNLTIGPTTIVTVKVEVTCSASALIHEKAVTRITAQDSIDDGVYGEFNVTNTLQNGIEGTFLTIETSRGRDYEPLIEVVGESRKTVNSLRPTAFRVKVTNMGFKMDSFRLKASVGSPIRGETRASDVWKIVFSLGSLVQDLNSINEGIGSSSIVYVNITAPEDAIYGDYPITITVASQLGNTEDSTIIKGVIPIPDLYAKADDIVFSRFPVIDGQSMIINITIHNDGGALEEEFKVEFWIEDTIKTDNYNIIGEATVEPIGNQGSAFATVVLIAELSPKIKETLTTVGIRVNIDSESTIIESDEDNNQVDNKIEILKAPKTTPAYSATLWMIIAMVAVGAILTLGEKYKLSRKNELQ